MTPEDLSLHAFDLAPGWYALKECCLYTAVMLLAEGNTPTAKRLTTIIPDRADKNENTERAQTLLLSLN